ncbi:right-handed parallel beta-helix repeat-containing protein [Humibacter sp.]|uniref:right-handed parallel beta-helix repeat-containing protein n=1 Tax=Humibacter sp. TaxID=1940291 RepID=UPI003F7F5138
MALLLRASRLKAGAFTVVLLGATAGLALTPAAAASAEPARTISVNPGGDVNAAIARARTGDTVALRPGTYRGTVRVDKAITLAANEATVDAPDDGAAIAVAADNVTIDSVATSCSHAAGSPTGIAVTAQHARIVGAAVLQCATGIRLDGARDAYLQGDSLLGSRSAGGHGVGVSASDADGVTMLGNTFEDDDTGVLVRGTATPLLDSNTFSQVGTAVELDAVSEAVVNGTLVVGATGPAVLVTGSRGAEIARLNPAGNGNGAGPAIELSAASGPSFVVDVEDSSLAHFATGLTIDAGSVTGSVIVIGTTFDGVERAAIVVAAGAGGTVNATIGDYFGGCGPRAPDHGYDGGGAVVLDPERAVSYSENNCRAPASAVPATSGGNASPPPAANNATGGSSGIDLPSAIGSTLVTIGVSVLLGVCAGGVLYAIRRNRHVH